MRCPGCDQDNPDSARFCNGCGTRLTAAATAVEPQTYTPAHIADKVRTSRAAMVGERKQVTVLFADLKGSMELLGDRDPEEARRLLDAVLERMMEAVHRYEGTVNQVMGDGIMALFGAPLAHEDHAVRACYAALRMQETVGRYAELIQKTEGISVRIRVGLNSGEVVVRSIGSDLKMDYTAVGQTTHLAARMEQMADPGTIIVAPSTLRLAEGAVQVAALGARPIKGLDAPIEVSELVGGASARSKVRSTDGQQLSRFIGRGAELERLHALPELARAGQGQVAAVSSEAGVGKTRLLYEFLHSAKTQPWRILEGRSHSYERAASYRPIIELLRAYFELDALDPASRVTEKVAATIRDLDPGPGDAVAPVLSLLDVLPSDDPFRALDARERHDRVVDALIHVLLKETERQPLVLVVENLQWADVETLAFLDTVLDRVPTARLLLLLEYRPEYEHDWAGRPGFNHLAIDPLSSAATDELLRTLLGDHRSLRPLRELLIQRSNGNPFFLEEIVRSLLETNALVGEHGGYRLARELKTIQVPATVQAVLAARIDRLPGVEKLLLQSSAVVGSDVPQALLEATCPPTASGGRWQACKPRGFSTRRACSPTSSTASRARSPATSPTRASCASSAECCTGGSWRRSSGSITTAARATSTSSRSMPRGARCGRRPSTTTARSAPARCCTRRTARRCRPSRTRSPRSSGCRRLARRSSRRSTCAWTCVRRCSSSAGSTTCWRSRARPRSWPPTSATSRAWRASTRI